LIRRTTQTIQAYCPSAASIPACASSAIEVAAFAARKFGVGKIQNKEQEKWQHR
jgi:hypothetical protein